MQRASRALVIGAGYAGIKHVEALREIGVLVEGPLSARRAAEDLALVARSDAEVVHVCAPNDLHVALAGAALRAGKDVVCEKPLALDVAGAEELEAVARSSGRLAVLGYNYRFHPMVVELATRVAAGEIGTPHALRGGFLQDWLLLSTDLDWRLEAARGGVSRAIADIGAHWVDLAEVVTGTKVEAVVAQVGQLHGRGTEDHADLLVRFSGGLRGACTLSQAAAGHRNDLELSVDGARRSATWRYENANELRIGSRDREMTIVTRDGPLASPAARALAALPSGPNEARRNLLAAVYARLAGDESAPAAALPTFADGVRHLRVAAAALESTRREKWVSIA